MTISHRLLPLLTLIVTAGCTGELSRTAGESGADWFAGAPTATPATPHMEAVLAFRGSRIVVEKSCTSCHTIGDRGGTVGPILDQLFNRRSEEWLRRWLKNPNDVKPGTKMPNFEFSPEEVDELFGFMANLRKDIPRDEILASEATPVEKGQRLFAAYDCLACHRIGSEGRFIGVDLTWVGLRKPEAWERTWLHDPEAWKPGTFMPTFGLSSGETEALSAYLHTLQGEKNEESRRWESQTLFFLGGSAQVAGEMVFKRFGCWGCHGAQGKAGDKNPNAAPAERVPDLWGVKNRLAEAAIRRTIQEGATPGRLNPSGPAPPFSCPSWGTHLAGRELDNLITYINTLAPKERVWKFQ